MGFTITSDKAVPHISFYVHTEPPAVQRGQNDKLVECTIPFIVL